MDMHCWSNRSLARAVQEGLRAPLLTRLGRRTPLVLIAPFALSSRNCSSEPYFPSPTRQCPACAMWIRILGSGRRTWQSLRSRFVGGELGFRLMSPPCQDADSDQAELEPCLQALGIGRAFSGTLGRAMQCTAGLATAACVGQDFYLSGVRALPCDQ